MQSYGADSYRRLYDFCKKVGTERRIPFEVAAPMSDYARALHRDSTSYRAGQLDTVSLEELMARYGIGELISPGAQKMLSTRLTPPHRSES